MFFSPQICGNKNVFLLLFLCIETISTQIENIKRKNFWHLKKQKMFMMNSRELIFVFLQHMQCTHKTDLFHRMNEFRYLLIRKSPSSSSVSSKHAFFFLKQIFIFYQKKKNFVFCSEPISFSSNFFLNFISRCVLCQVFIMCVVC